MYLQAYFALRRFNTLSSERQGNESESRRQTGVKDGRQNDSYVGVTQLPPANETGAKIMNGQPFWNNYLHTKSSHQSQTGSRFSLNAGIFYASPFAYFPGYHKTDSQFALSRLSLHCLKLGHHISRHNYSQNLSKTNLLSISVPLLWLFYV